MRMERVECPECGKEVAAYVPAGGDGSALRPRAHVSDTGLKCSGKHHLVDARETFLPGELRDAHRQ